MPGRRVSVKQGRLEAMAVTATEKRGSAGDGRVRSATRRRPSRIDYYRRVLSTSALGAHGHRSFWHETPEVNAAAFGEGSRGYFMTFAGKAEYTGPFDGGGVPQLDYQGNIGVQYNPIAVAQYALGNYNRFLETGQAERRETFLRQANWLVENLESNAGGLRVWHHHFNWYYREGLAAPWYSALAQGPGISVLLRAFVETSEERFRQAADAAFQPFLHDVSNGGVTVSGDDGDLWLEEYLVEPPSHVLNGMIWASWGLYDLWRMGQDDRAKGLFQRASDTLVRHLHRYDTGFWSCYELRPGRVPMVASAFYHRLHIVQLDVMHRLTREDAYAARARRWRRYDGSRAKKALARLCRIAFKIAYY